MSNNTLAKQGDLRSELQLAEKTEESFTGIVSKRVEGLISQGRIDFPPDYSYSNALKSAWLKILETEDLNHRPALDVCTKASIYNALFDMVIQGLTSAKDQVYFIVYGNKLCCQKSYFGEMALAMRVDPSIVDIKSNIVYDGDKFEFEIVDGDYKVVTHRQTLESIDSGTIKAAYCTFIRGDKALNATTLMTYEEIKKSWAMSKMKPFTDKGELKAGTVHSKFPGEMAKRTVINRACKTIINRSGDTWLKKAIEDMEVRQAVYEAEEERKEKANSENFDFLPAKAEVIEEKEEPEPKTAVREKPFNVRTKKESPKASPKLEILKKKKDLVSEEEFYEILGHHGYTDIEEVKESDVEEIVGEILDIHSMNAAFSAGPDF
jgi:recombination protein RecT